MPTQQMMSPESTPLDDSPPTPVGPVVVRAAVALIPIVIGAAFLLAWARKQVDVASQHPAVGKLVKINLEPIPDDDEATSGAGPTPTLPGKVSLVHMWGPWCEMCRAELPHILTLADELKGNPQFQMVSISYPPEPIPDLRNLAKETRAALHAAEAPFEAYFDHGLVTYQQINAICERNMIFPTTFVVGRDGRITAFWQGYAPGMEVMIHDAVHEALDRS